MPPFVSNYPRNEGLATDKYFFSGAFEVPCTIAQVEQRGKIINTFFHSFHVCNFSRRRSILWKSINIRNWKHEGTQVKFGKIGNSPSMSKITIRWTEFSYPYLHRWSSSLPCLRYHSPVLYTFWRDNGSWTHRADTTPNYRNLCDSVALRCQHNSQR